MPSAIYFETGTQSSCIVSKINLGNLMKSSVDARGNLLKKKPLYSRSEAIDTMTFNVALLGLLFIGVMLDPSYSLTFAALIVQSPLMRDRS